jgi:hypothetical protein
VDGERGKRGVSGKLMGEGKKGVVDIKWGRERRIM